MGPSRTQYVSVGGADIAYQVAGAGARNILWMYGLGTQIDVAWQLSSLAKSLEYLASISRVMIFDRRGSGASDPAPVGAAANWELVAEDIGAVLDATNAEQCVLIGFRETGQIAAIYTAMHPERVSALVLLNTSARYLRSVDHPSGEAPEMIDHVVGLVQETWGTEEFGRITSPSFANDPEWLRISSIGQRASGTPTQAAAQYESFLRDSDIRAVLPSIRVPTLVLHVRDNPILPPAHGRFLADHIAGARYVELPGGDLGGGLVDGALEEVAEFVTGVRLARPVDRILATVLFTDIVGSTQRAAEIGDKAWHELLDQHDRAVRAEFERFRGREVKTTGDGFLASFDGPGRAIECAHALHHATEQLRIPIRVGIHTGECEVRGSDLAGLAVHIAARVCGATPAGRTYVSRTVADLVTGSGVQLDPLGEHELKGVPDAWALFEVSQPAAASERTPAS